MPSEIKKPIKVFKHGSVLIMDDFFNPVKVDEKNPDHLSYNHLFDVVQIPPASLSDSNYSTESQRAQMNSQTPSISSTLDFGKENLEIINSSSNNYFEFFQTPLPTPFPSISYEEPDFKKNLPSQKLSQVQNKNVFPESNYGDKNWILLPSFWSYQSRDSKKLKN